MDQVEEAILRLTAARGPDKSIDPSEVARALGENWHAWMKPVRDAALRLARVGQVEVLRKGKKVEELAEVRGVIRLRMVGKKEDVLS
jgi:hypothetical protein